jgi:hypothetical protein
MVKQTYILSRRLKMKLLLWNVYLSKPSVANIQWILYKWFGLKRNIPCGRTRKDDYLCCELMPTRNNSFIINDGDTHEIRCKVCGSLHMNSNRYISDKCLDDMLYDSYESDEDYYDSKCSS